MGYQDGRLHRFVKIMKRFDTFERNLTFCSVPNEGGKMATNWTSNQLQAINKKEKNILVAAAARKRKDYCAC